MSGLNSSFCPLSQQQVGWSLRAPLIINFLLLLILGFQPSLADDFEASLKAGREKDPDWIWMTGHSRAEGGDYSGAITDYTRALQMNPKQPVYYQSRAFALMKLGRYEEAIDDSKQAIELDPTASLPYLSLGQALLLSG